MMRFPGQLASGSGVVELAHPKLLPYRIQRRRQIRSNGSITFASHQILGGRIQCNQMKHVGSNHLLSARVTRHGSGFDDELPEEPFWLSLIKDVIWSMRSLFSFLVEQPSQLKYIEWPSFKSTLKTATLSLVLVAIFIVALSSVDSALCYLLALVLRKTP